MSKWGQNKIKCFCCCGYCCGCCCWSQKPIFKFWSEFGYGWDVFVVGWSFLCYVRLIWVGVVTKLSLNLFSFTGIMSQTHAMGYIGNLCKISDMDTYDAEFRSTEATRVPSVILPHNFVSMSSQLATRNMFAVKYGGQNWRRMNALNTSHRIERNLIFFKNLFYFWLNLYFGKTYQNIKDYLCWLIQKLMKINSKLYCPYWYICGFAGVAPSNPNNSFSGTKCQQDLLC